MSNINDDQLQTTAGIAALTTADIADLNTTHVSSLSTTLISALSTAQIPALTTANIAVLSTAQVAALTTAQIPSLTTTQVAALSIADIAALTDAEIAALGTAQIAAFSEKQIVALRAPLTTDQAKALTPAKTAALTAALSTALRTTKSKELATVSGLSDKFLDGNTHAGVTVHLRASGKPSSLVIPDVTGVKNGKSPVFVSKPLQLQGKNLEKFLKNKQITLPEEATRLIGNTDINLNAFYYIADEKDASGKVTRDGSLLMNIQATNETGLIQSLTGDKDLGELFDITGVSVQVLRCTKDNFDELRAYVKELNA